ncbi:MAG TPA: EAL domain-containing protein [Acidimicrobiales bacterium]|nr:EAL domain-containing protein [Acidimicrobiales bacterium]
MAAVADAAARGEVAPEGLARLLMDLPDVTVVLDGEGKVIWGNDAAERLFGLTLHETVGRSGLEFVHPDDLELVLRSLVSVQAKVVGTPIEVRLKTQTGWSLFELIGAPVTWFAETAVLFSLRDLTQRRRYEVARDEVAMFRSLVQNSATITMLLSSSGLIVSASGALTRVLGHDPERVENQPLIDLVAAPDVGGFATAFDRALQGATVARPTIVEVSLLSHNSPEPIPFELTIVNLVDDPTVGGLVVTAHDISLKTAAESELQTTLSLLKATLDATADGILVVDTEGRITSFNSRFAEMWRIPPDLLAARDDNAAIGFVLDQLIHPEAFVSKIEELYGQPEADSNDTLAFKDGRVFDRYSKPQLIDGNVVGRVWSFRDVTEHKRLESELTYQAFHDALTGLANKALFRDHLDQAVARMERTHKRIAVLFLDMDDFKTVNDSLGHSVGDQLLMIVGNILADSMRTSDTVARLGGDEFALLIEDIEAATEATEVAERILTSLQRPLRLGIKEVVPTVSIGIVIGNLDSTSEQLLRDADLAMYRAKENGKNRYEEFRDQMHVAVVERLELEAGLRQALANQELTVHYQPIVKLESFEIVGFEALVRWHHPSRGTLQPESFIPFAEQVGLVSGIDRFVLTDACKQVLRWQEQGLIPAAFSLSINVSAREMVDAAIGESVAELLATTAFDPSNLILEITESAMMRDTETAIGQMHALKALGLRISIDDFGTGYSSLAYLQRLPIDSLKIDRSFVSSLSEWDTPAGLVHAIIQIADTLGHTTIAEGVENATQVMRLRHLGCELGQGFHIGLPLDAPSTEAMLKARAGGSRSLSGPTSVSV